MCVAFHAGRAWDTAGASGLCRAAMACTPAQLGSKVLGLLAQCGIPRCKVRRGCRCQDKVSHLPAAPAGPPLQAGPNSEVEGKCAFTSINRALSNCIRLGSACQSMSVYANGEHGCLPACLQATCGAGAAAGWRQRQVRSCSQYGPPRPSCTLPPQAPTAAHPSPWQSSKEKCPPAPMPSCPRTYLPSSSPSVPSRW